MSATTTPAASATARSVLGPRFMMRLVLAAAVALGIVAAAVGPRRAALGLTHMPAIHLHAPDVGLVAHAPLAIKLHLFAVMLAFTIGVALLIGVKGRAFHRTLGWVWVVAMMTGAVSSLFIRIINHGALSYIHLLAGWTIVALPMAVFAARTHRVKAHARFMTGLFTGGLILAGLLAFLPGRLMWQIFLG